MFGTSRKLFLFFAVTMSLLAVPVCFAQPSYKPIAQPPAQSAAPDINSLEQRYFGRLYDKDATDKRIQRLELLLFGATQDGGLVDRLDRLQASAAERLKSSKVSVNQAVDIVSIAALEKKILKKSFGSETPTQRLARLESKVFGQASPAMNISDRVFRLKKILNVDTPSISQYPSSPDLGSGDMSSPFGGGFMYNSPFGSNRPEDIAQQMNEAMRQLNKSLRGIHRLPDGAPNVSPFTGPNGTPFMQPFRTGPQPGRDTELPPYLDPNSI